MLVLSGAIVVHLMVVTLLLGVVLGRARPAWTRQVWIREDAEGYRGASDRSVQWLALPAELLAAVSIAVLCGAAGAWPVAAVGLQAAFRIDPYASLHTTDVSLAFGSAALLLATVVAALRLLARASGATEQARLVGITAITVSALALWAVLALRDGPVRFWTMPLYDLPQLLLPLAGITAGTALLRATHVAALAQIELED